MESQKTSNSQSNPEKKEQNWRYHTPWLQIILQSDGDQNTIVLAEKHKWSNETELKAQK